MVKTNYNKKLTDSFLEWHDNVDKKNKVIGQARRIEFLENPVLIRRSCHVWLKNSKGEYWFQKRSKNKDIQPLHWSCAAAGYVKAGADSERQILAEAKRELKEELGIDINFKFKKILYHQSKNTSSMFIYVFVGDYNGPFAINAEEVEKIKAFEINGIWRLYQDKKIKLTEPTITELKYFFKKAK
ncbi:MAG: Dimethyladenosine transferase [Parcubacteria group bacterium GW2011_GWC2_45_15]|nr:MAG: Dimethyladenosine transferase [Parcubacteria group bacterium GW2011_GWC2_45_15]OGY96075.1 MAG: hypothetical protein A3J95_02475 [Candidatus Komeilibacteria bacterium RIFOXYC2_FULL_45_12]